MPPVFAAPAIETRELAKSYGATPALKPATLTVPAGAVFALVGHNGAGKTTLIKLLMNILVPSAGSATVLGRPASTLTGAAFERIGYVSENQDLPLWMTVRQFLDYNKPFYPHWDADSLVEHLELPLDRKLKHLSRGMLMKAALASALAFNPELIVLDEVFSGLDPLVRDELIAALIARTRSTGATVLVSSHDLAEVEAFATHIGFLHQGTFLFTEEMTSLASRFREVTIHFPAPQIPLAATNPGGPSFPVSAKRVESAQIPQFAAPSPAEIIFPPTPPADWLLIERAGNTVRFVHPHADTADVRTETLTAFPNATYIEAAPMSLRSIFLALAKSGRVPADPAPAATAR